MLDPKNERSDRTKRRAWAGLDPKKFILVFVTLMMLAVVRVGANNIQPADPGSGTGGITILSTADGYCEGLSVDFAEFDPSYGATKVPTTATNMPSEVIVQKDIERPTDFRKLNQWGNDVPGDCPQCRVVRGKAVKITLIGPVLSSKDSRTITSSLKCSVKGFALTAYITRKAVNDANPSEDHLWRPKIKLRAVMYQAEAPFEAKWVIENPNGVLVDRVTTLPEPEQIYPIRIEKTIRSDGTVVDGIANFLKPNVPNPGIRVTKVNGVSVLPRPSNDSASDTMPPSAPAFVINDPADNEGLLFAVRSNNALAVETELKKGADVNQRDKNGDTALMFSVMYGFKTPRIVNLLLSHGAHVNLQANNGDTALMLASGAGNGGSGVEIVKILLQHGADPNIGDAFGQTALTIASSGNQKDVIQVLSEAMSLPKTTHAPER